MKHCKIQHPALYIFLHPLVTDSGLHIAGRKLRKFDYALFRRGCTDPVKELIYIKICRRCRNRVVFPFSDQCSPGEITAKLSERQITVGRKIADELTRPRHSIFIILHENTLPIEILTFQLKRSVLILIETSHFANSVRDRILRLNRYPFGKRQDCIAIYRSGSSRNRIKNDGKSPWVICF